MPTFKDDDRGYLEWVARHPQGFVVNSERQPRPSYLRLHRAICATITGTPARGNRWTAEYIKICSDNLAELEAWARGQTGGELHPCPSCGP
jgi:hypothetical protein